MRILAILLLLAGCAEFPIEANLEQMKQLQCKPAASSMCDGWNEAS